MKRDYSKIEVDGETVYLAKNKLLGWSVINPYKIDGVINWKNILIGGSWVKFGITVGLVLLILGCISEYSTAVTIANECLTKSNFIIT